MGLLNFFRKPKSTKLFTRLENLYELFQIIPKKGKKHEFVTFGAFNFKSNLGKVAVIISSYCANDPYFNDESDFDYISFSYIVPNKNKGVLFSIDAYRGRQAKITPNFTKNGKLKTHETVDLAILEIEEYLRDNYGTLEEIRNYNKEEIKKLGGTLDV